MKPFPPPAATRTRLPDWPRLMPIGLAARYLGISETTFREVKPVAARKLRGCVLYDREDLDRFADALAGQPALDRKEEESHKRNLERAWLEARKERGR